MPPFKTPPPTKSPSTPNTEGLYYSTRWTNLDIEDNDPKNYGEQNHKQKYTGKEGETYLDNYQVKKSYSDFGVDRTGEKFSPLHNKNIFKITNLDLEEEEVIGGPAPKDNGFEQPYTPDFKYMNDDGTINTTD